MQLKDIFSASSDRVSQPSNSTLRFKQKALAATILATLAIIAFIAVEASDTKPARKAPTEAAMITLRPDGTDKDVLIARYDANFLALSRRIEEVDVHPLNSISHSQPSPKPSPSWKRNSVARSLKEAPKDSGSTKPVKVFCHMRKPLSPMPTRLPQQSQP